MDKHALNVLVNKADEKNQIIASKHDLLHIISFLFKTSFGFV